MRVRRKARGARMASVILSTHAHGMHTNNVRNRQARLARGIMQFYWRGVELLVPCMPMLRIGPYGEVMVVCRSVIGVLPRYLSGISWDTNP